MRRATRLIERPNTIRPLRRSDARLAAVVPVLDRVLAWAFVSTFMMTCGGSSPLLGARADASASDGGVDHASPGDDEVGGRADAATGGTIAAGFPCATGSACASGFCFDGVCCNSDCSAACWSCALTGSVGSCVPVEVGTDPRADCADDGLASCGHDGACDGAGACRRYPPGLVCRPPSCRGATLTQAFRCNGVGSCGLTTGQTCDPYLCDPNGDQCLTACRVSADCVPGRVCIGGRCGRNPLGAPCSSDDDCNSSSCQQGVCCAGACTGTCRSCALPGSAGACIAVPRGQDPLADCADQTAPSCGTDGTCDGAGACERYVSSTVCSPAVCAGTVFTSASTCDGVGVCHTGPSLNCGLYQCSGSGCKTRCTASTDCAALNVCIGGACGAPTNLRLQYFSRASNPTVQSPRPQFQITNLAATPVPLSELTIRYWYTSDGPQPQSAVIDFADVGAANITKVFVPLLAPRNLADSYWQIGFTPLAGNVAGGGASSGQVQLRFNKSDFTPYDQTNDYSFDATKTTFADWDRVTLYRLGILAWGVEPVAR